MFLNFIVFLSAWTYGMCSEGPIVTLPNGRIQGVVAKTSRHNLTYYAFMGIPYAAAPLGNRRFKAPQPAFNWDGILQANSMKKICFQTGLEHIHASEDCLFINIYTPVKPGTNAKLPVMINIHGGTFIRGTAMSAVDAAQYVLEQNVVVATINYRLGPFGFLSTLDTVIPGNMGIKDQQFALKWLQTNVHLFGGDPAKVTLMGQSAGSASVTYQLLGRGAQGLFRAAIAQSGSALCTWAHQRHPVDTAYGIAAHIDPTFTRNKSTQELLNFLLKVDAKAIHNATFTYKIFSPVVEVEHEGAMITQSMYEAVKNGNVLKVPVLMGICSEEALFVASNLNTWKRQTAKYDQNPALLVDEDMGITDSNTLSIVGKKIKNIYTNGLFEDHLGKAVQYFGDNRFMRPVIKYAELQAQHSDLYFYQFSYHGTMGHNKISFADTGKVTHAEDLYYFWTNTYHTLNGLPVADVRTMNRYIGLLTNFAKYLNPTPSKSELFENVIWPKVTKNNFHYLDLDTHLTIKENPRNFSFSKWVNIFETYAAKPMISY